MGLRLSHHARNRLSGARRTAWLAALVLVAVPATAAASRHKATKPAKVKSASPPPAPPPKAPAKAAPADDVEPIEDVTPTPETGKQSEPAAAKEEATSLTTVIGHMHSAMVHMPIAWLILLVLCDVGWLVFDRRELQMGGMYLSVLTCLSFVPAIVSGLLRLSQLPQDPVAAAPALLHRNVMYACAALCCGLATLRVSRRQSLQGAWRWLYLTLIATAFLVVSVGGHMGGKLVFGDDFLPF